VRRVLAQEAAHYQQAIELANARNRLAQPWCASTPPVRAEITLPQSEIDILGTEPAHQLLQQEEFLDRRMRRTQRADLARTVLVNHRLEPIGGELQSLLPIDPLPFPTLLDHGRNETLVTVQTLVRESILVRQPALVDFFVLER